jgi:uncharacterized membrane protein
MCWKQQKAAMKSRLLDTLRDRIGALGRLPLCNQLPDHAPRAGSLCFPLCWRCVGVLTGFVCFLMIDSGLRLPARIGIGLLLLLPCAIDGMAQRQWHIPSTTLRRVITGLLAGIGCALL